MEISRVPETEADFSSTKTGKVELTPQQIKEQQALFEHQQQMMLKERKRRVKVLKEDVEWMETNYKYMQLRMALPELEFKYNQFLQKEEELIKQQQSVKENMDNKEEPVKEAEVTNGTNVEEGKS